MNLPMNLYVPDGYDQEAVAWIEALETKLARLPRERQGAFAVILDAIEYQIEERHGDPTVVRLLGEALLALAVAQRLPLALVKDITQLLGRLHAHVVERAAPPHAP